ncbi:melanization protease 1-like [Paramacrobiotus metropolitanus]|uniref:melanization protease 1-like n=1 Tax=Paramacrobiotus metropolitanus TaxID=2943436 RepID=UPI00244583E5|nr:melanization protease 1-like [Paramacrobiotus metropolitanus]
MSSVLYRCGGVIIGSRTILTAAHCLLHRTTSVPLPVSSIQVVVGAVNSGAPATNVNDPTGCAQTFTAESLIIHPAYNHELNDNDIAIITLTTAINVDQKPCACTLCFSARQPTVGEQCAVTGYGIEMALLNFTVPRRNPVPLKWVAQTIVNQGATNKCPAFPNSAGAITNLTMKFCTHGPDDQGPCLGDDGSALVCWDPANNGYYLAGLIAIGPELCAIGLSDWSAQSTKVALYLQWIADNSVSGDVNLPASSIVSTPTPAPSETTNSPITAPGTTEACGIPGSGPIDAFGIVSQMEC